MELNLELKIRSKFENNLNNISYVTKDDNSVAEILTLIEIVKKDIIEKVNNKYNTETDYEFENFKKIKLNDIL